jgi:hypothetical protein
MLANLDHVGDPIIIGFALFFALTMMGPESKRIGRFVIEIGKFASFFVLALSTLSVGRTGYFMGQAFQEAAKSDKFAYPFDVTLPEFYPWIGACLGGLIGFTLAALLTSGRAALLFRCAEVFPAPSVAT